MNVVARVRGFTLVELLVVIAIISVLTSAVAIYSLRSSELSRNIKRQSDLTMLKNAVEQYKLSYGRYPAGCNGANNWSGEFGSPSNACPSGNPQYIVGLAPEFIPVLPRDPRRTGTGEGYAYVTNAAGTVYKIIAMGTVEGVPVTDSHPFKSCDVIYNPTNPNNDIKVDGYCGALYTGDSSPTQTEVDLTHQCNGSHQRFQTSYAVWGGFAPLQAIPGSGSGFPDECLSSGWCVNPNPPNPTDDPLDSFIRGTELSTSSPSLQPSLTLRTVLIVRAVNGTTQIICK